MITTNASESVLRVCMKGFHGLGALLHNPADKVRITASAVNKPPSFAGDMYENE